MSRNAVLLAVMGVTLWCALPSSADVVIQASKAAVKTEGGPLADDVWNLWSQGRVGQPLRIAADGTHQVVIRAWGSPAAGMWPEMALLVDGRPAKTVTVDRTERADFRFNVELTEGIHEIAAAFLNDAVIGGEDRNLYLDRLTIIPPKGAKDAALVGKEELFKEAEHRPLMEMKFPEWADLAAYWHIDDLDCAEPEEALPLLEEKVRGLIEDLRSGPK